ncbi:hypothetical protein [Bradyrhizobium sp. RT4b]|uniref:hypothetical protein n=1 Tax=Bradyrhizobium sp. RT4b TaxID=3156379 RepID=UPI00339886D8
MANAILWRELSFLDFRRKFGACVKPIIDAASAPFRMMLRSLSMSSIGRESMPEIIRHVRAALLLYTLLSGSRSDVANVSALGAPDNGVSIF